MTAALTGSGVIIVVADVALLALSWRRRAALSGVAVVVSLGLVFVALAARPRPHGRVDLLVIAALALIIGALLHGLGQAVQRLLDQPDDDRD